MQQHAAAATPRPHLVLGTMTFGGQTAFKDAREQLRLLVEASATQGLSRPIIDTARLYRGGRVESVLGDILASEPAWKQVIEVHTKADPSCAPFTYAGLSSQLDQSLEALGVPYVQVFYLHMPDTSVPIEQTLEACNALHIQGKFVELGLSNYPAWEVVRCYHICKERGWVKPSIYQGVYHILTRSVEYELIPALRTLGIRFNVFSPLCGGLLADDAQRYLRPDQTHRIGRFSPEYHNHDLYVARYFLPQNFEALSLLKQAAREHDIPLYAIALRWLAFHSYLRAGDGIVFGGGAGSRRCADDLSCLKDGPLPSALVSLINGPIAVLVYPIQAQYLRGYDPVHGRSDRYLRDISGPPAGSLL